MSDAANAARLYDDTQWYRDAMRTATGHLRQCATIFAPAAMRGHRGRIAQTSAIDFDRGDKPDRPALRVFAESPRAPSPHPSGPGRP